jgi:3-hydroxy-9,10-secoandrosta-1,3,5(10)-triene-9,17-dione monooxygenase reductase component
MVILAPAKSSTSWPRIARAGAFCVNILGSTRRRCAVPSPSRAATNSTGSDWTPGVTGAPLIDWSLAAVECTLGAIYEGGDHELVTGHVVTMEIGEGSPLLFYRSGFGRFVA